jgi:hypothetical protein
MATMTGGCLCGGVTVRLSEPIRQVGACHCATCRRWTSGPWMALRAPPDTHMEGETLEVYRSSEFAERGFCRRCGAHIFHRPQLGPEIAVSAGLFPPQEMKLTREIFFDLKPAFYSFAQDTLKRSSFVMALAWAPRILWRSLRRSLSGGPA